MKDLPTNCNFNREHHPGWLLIGLLRIMTPKSGNPNLHQPVWVRLKIDDWPRIHGNFYVYRENVLINQWMALGFPVSPSNFQVPWRHISWKMVEIHVPIWRPMIPNVYWTSRRMTQGPRDPGQKINPHSKKQGATNGDSGRDCPARCGR